MLNLKSFVCLTCVLGAAFAAQAQTLPASKHAAPEKKASPSMDAPINIGESDVDTGHVSEPSVSHESGSTSETRNLEETFEAEKAEAKKAATDAATPDLAFPHYATLFVLDAIEDDYVTMQKVSATVAASVQGGFGSIDSREKLGIVRLGIDQLDKAANRLLDTLKQSPGVVADKLVQQGYDQVTVSKRLYKSLSEGPLLVLKAAADNTVKKTTALKNLVADMDKFWGKWKMEKDGSLTLDSSLSKSDHDEFYKAFGDAIAAIRSH